MGTAPFAVPCLKALAASGREVAAVVTQPDRPTGRGLKLQASAVKLAAVELGLPVLQPERASHPDFAEQLRALAPERIVVVAYGQILKPHVLDIPPGGCVNVHGSILPELRGAAPIAWAVIRGYAETGVTTMCMDPGMDTGDMLLWESIPIGETETAGELAERLAPLGAALLLRTLDGLERAELTPVPQDSSCATYAPLLKRETGSIDWSRPAGEILHLIHGCNPAPGAFTLESGQVLKIWRARPAGSAGGMAGEVMTLDPLTVACGEGTLELVEVHPAGRARCSGSEVARGRRWAIGSRLGEGSE